MMPKAVEKPFIYRDPPIIRKVKRDGADRSIRRAYEALLQEPVPDELTDLAKSLNRRDKT